MTIIKSYGPLMYLDHTFTAYQGQSMHLTPK